LPLFGPRDINKLASKGDLEGLLAALTNRREWRARQEAAETFGRVRDPRAVEPLIVALRDDVSGVQRAAAVALGGMADPRAVEPLLVLLKSHAADVRAAAADALGRLGNVSSVGPLINVLKDESWSVRRAATEALGRIGDQAAVGPIGAALSDRDSHVGPPRPIRFSRSAHPQYSRSSSLSRCRVPTFAQLQPTLWGDYATRVPFGLSSACSPTPTTGSATLPRSHSETFPTGALAGHC
jgi:hypothetical protein